MRRSSSTTVSASTRSMSRPPPQHNPPTSVASRLNFDGCVTDLHGIRFQDSDQQQGFCMSGAYRHPSSGEENASPSAAQTRPPQRRYKAIEISSGSEDEDEGTPPTPTQKPIRKRTRLATVTPSSSAEEDTAHASTEACPKASTPGHCDILQQRGRR